LSAALATDAPPQVIELEPPVPAPVATRSVSPWITVTRSGGRSRCSPALRGGDITLSATTLYDPSRGLMPIGVTIVPRHNVALVAGNTGWNDSKTKVRNEVNAWIRGTLGYFQMGKSVDLNLFESK
jgi:hypothetical protein